MAELSEKNYRTILEALHNSAGVKLHNPALIPELADHIACIIENEYADTVNFDSALAAALAEICPEGTAKIDLEIYNYLTFNYSQTMKKVFYGSLFAALFFVSNGLMFRFFQWEGAKWLLLTGNLLLLLPVCPLLAIVLFRNLSLLTLTEKLQQTAALACCFFLGFGSILKIMYLPGANINLLAGFVTLNLLFIPTFLYRSYLQAVR